MRYLARLLIIVASLVCCADNARSQVSTAVVNFNFATLVQTPNRIQWLSLQTVPSVLNGTNYQGQIFTSVAQNPSLTNGFFSTNVVCGLIISGTWSDGYNTYTTNFYFPSSIAGGSVSAWQYVGLYNNQIPAFFYANQPSPVAAGNSGIGITNIGGTNFFYNLSSGGGGSATNALINGPGGIYDASLVTNVLGSHIVGTLTNSTSGTALGITGTLNASQLTGTLPLATLPVGFVTNVTIQQFGGGIAKWTHDVSFTNGSTTIYSPSGLFVPSDVGSYVCLYTNITHTNWLLSPIASYLSANRVVLSAAPLVTATGATMNWGPDNVSACSNAVWSCPASGTVNVYFPKGMYMMVGTMPAVGATNGYNQTALIPCPIPSYSATNLPYTVNFIGEGSGRLNYSGFFGYPATRSGTILFCPQFQNSSNCCVFGLSNTNDTYTSFTLNFQNIRFMEPPSPQLCWFNNLYGGGSSVKDSSFTTDFGAMQITRVIGGHGTPAFIPAGHNANGEQDYDGVDIIGFDIGFEGGDHMKVLNCVAGANGIGWYATGGGYVDNHGEMVSLINNLTNICIQGGGGFPNMNGLFYVESQSGSTIHNLFDFNANSILQGAPTIHVSSPGGGFSYDDTTGTNQSAPYWNPTIYLNSVMASPTNQFVGATLALNHFPNGIQTAGGNGLVTQGKDFSTYGSYYFGYPSSGFSYNFEAYYSQFNRLYFNESAATPGQHIYFYSSANSSETADFDFDAGIFTATNFVGAFTGNGLNVTNQGYVRIITTTNGIFAPTKNSDGSTNLVFTPTNLPAATITGALPAINAAALTSLNASQLTSGTVSLGLLPTPVVTNGGSFTVGTAVHPGSISFINATQDGPPQYVTNDGYDGLAFILPAATTQITFSNASFGIGIYAANFFGKHTGDGSGLTGLNAGNLGSGVVPLAQIPTTLLSNNVQQVYLTNLAFGSYYFTNGSVVTVAIGTNGIAGAGGAANGLYTNVTSGTVASAVNFTNAANSFTGNLTNTEEFALGLTNNLLVATNSDGALGTVFDVIGKGAIFKTNLISTAAGTFPIYSLSTNGNFSLYQQSTNVGFKVIRASDGNAGFGWDNTESLNASMYNVASSLYMDGNGFVINSGKTIRPQSGSVTMITIMTNITVSGYANITNGVTSFVSNNVPLASFTIAGGNATTFFTNMQSFSVLVGFVGTTITGVGICPTNGGVTSQFWWWPTSLTGGTVPCRSGASISFTNGVTAGSAAWTPFP